MDVLTIDGKNYVKASVIARELGYTADYVGQLCRQGKVDAKLFGRSWYVDKNSIGEHKGTRYRSTQAKSVQALKIETETPKPLKVAITTQSSNPLFYTHSTLKASPRYISDESELIPRVGIGQKKEGNLRVELAEATPVSITSKDDSFIFDTPKLPEIHFKGKLSITEFSPSDSLVEDGGKLLHPTEVNKLISEKRPNIIASSPVHKNEKHQKEEAGGTKIVTVDLDPTVTPVAFLHQVQEPVLIESAFKSVFIAVGTALVAVFVILGLETHISATSSTLSMNYFFEIGNVLASVYLSQNLLTSP